MKKKERHFPFSSRDILRYIEISIQSTAALARKESRGGHYREDYPVVNEDWNKNIILEASHSEGYFMDQFHKVY